MGLHLTAAGRRAGADGPAFPSIRSTTQQPRSQGHSGETGRASSCTAFSLRRRPGFGAGYGEQTTYRLAARARWILVAFDLDGAYSIPGDNIPLPWGGGCGRRWHPPPVPIAAL